MNDSLEKLAKNITISDKKYTSQEFQDVELIKRKDVYPYDYMDSRRRLKGIHSRSDTNRTGAEGLSFYYPRLLHCLDSDAGSDVIKPALSFVIQNRHTSCSMWCPMYRARC